MLSWEAWCRLKVGRPGRSGYADFKHERKVERALWKWRAKRGNKGWIGVEREAYRLGLFTATMIVTDAKNHWKLR